MSFISSPFPTCFRPKTTDDHHPPPPLLSSPTTLTTSTFLTDSGTVSLTWSRSILGRTLLLHFDSSSSSSSSSSSFCLHIQPFIFWKKHGSKKLSPNTRIFWNLSKAVFGSSPEPQSGFYVALVVDNVLTLVVGDISPKEARAKCKAREAKTPQVMVMKRVHVDVVAQRVYATRVRFGGKVREIEVDCENNSKLLFCVDGERVLEVKRLKWKFRGNERVEVDGVSVQISWDVHNWLFYNDHCNIINNLNNNNNNLDGHAVFMFKFEEEEVVGRVDGRGKEGLVDVWTQQNWNMGSCEWGKIGKSWSSSSISMSSSLGSFGGSSSVLEWSSVEENELTVPIGFSLLVYAWKR